MMVLVSRRTVSLRFSAQNDPDTYFRTRSGLWVSDDFRSRIGAKAKGFGADTPFIININEISQEGGGATDKEIEGALPAKYLLDESEICAIIETMISEQSGGKEGNLEHTGKANLFYTSSCVVGVLWGADVVEWDVLTWDRDGDRWDAGGRVFFPAN
jgi:hypothetical protein